MKNTILFTENVTSHEDNIDNVLLKQYNGNYAEATSPAAMSDPELFEVPQRYVEMVAPPDGQHRASQLQIWNNHMISDQAATEATQLKLNPRDEQKDALPNLAYDVKANITNDLTIPWSDLVLKERIGAGKLAIYLISSLNYDFKKTLSFVDSCR